MSNANAWVHLNFQSDNDATIKHVIELLLRDESLTISDLKIYANGTLTEWWPLNQIESVTNNSTVK